MQIEHLQYSDEKENQWDDFIKANKRNATFLHSRKFFLHNRLNKIDDSSLMFYKKGKLIAVLPACLYDKENRLIFHSHARSTYGGFVIHESVGIEEAEEIVKITIQFAKKKNVNEVIITNPFRILNQMPSDEMDYAMWHNGFKIRSRDVECVVTLKDGPENYDKGAKANTKKALKLVEIKECDLYKEFWEILTINLAKKHKAAPTHTYQDFMQLRQLIGVESIKLFGGFVQGKLACGVIIFVFQQHALHAQYIANHENFQEMRPLNAVIDFIIRWGREKNFKYFNLGKVTEDFGRKINYGLAHFKEGFLARGVLRETMHLFLE